MLKKGFEAFCDKRHIKNQEFCIPIFLHFFLKTPEDNLQLYRRHKIDHLCKQLLFKLEVYAQSFIQIKKNIDIYSFLQLKNTKKTISEREIFLPLQNFKITPDVPEIPNQTILALLNARTQFRNRDFLSDILEIAQHYYYYYYYL